MIIIININFQHLIIALLVVAAVISSDAKLFNKKKWAKLGKWFHPKGFKGHGIGGVGLGGHEENIKIVEVVKHVPVIQKVEVVKPVEIIKTVHVPGRFEFFKF